MFKMKIVVISDTHDREKELKSLIREFNENLKPDKLIHCGDLVSPFMFKELSNFKGEVHVVFGYQDVGSLVNLVKEDNLLSQKDNLNIHDEFGELSIDGKKIAFIHNNLLAKRLAESGNYDVVFYGHTHEAKEESVNETKLVNPGDIMGRKNKPSHALYDTETEEIKFLDFNNN